jgi:ubiquinone biosynthesis monooxygenase Coq7
MDTRAQAFDAAARRCATQVMFDGSCPLCRAEISAYQDAARQGESGSAPRIEWVDVSAQAAPNPDPSLSGTNLAGDAAPSLEQMRQRFHVRTAQGQWLSGAAAFVHLWAQLPRWRWLAVPARVPGVLPLMEWGYRGFLRLRPSLQRLAAWGQRRVKPASPRPPQG